mgnify:CR=1 FL=1
MEDNHLSSSSVVIPTKPCIVCGKPARALFASGNSFCNEHAACSECHIVLSNGELQQALVRMGSPNERSALVILRNRGNGDPRSAKMLQDALDWAVVLLHTEGVKLSHASGSTYCRPPHAAGIRAECQSALVA